MKKISKKQLQQIVAGVRVTDEALEDRVGSIISGVRMGGDKALLAYTEKYDGVSLASIRVPQKEIKGAAEELDSGLASLVLKTAGHVKSYHEKQKPGKFSTTVSGVRVECRFKPVESVGVYVPGGQAPLVSTLLMTIPVARVAGVTRISVATPPSKGGKVSPVLLGVAGLLGVNDIFQVGGAQAVAALALGTETVSPVDLVVGPGNRYVNAAKKLLYGEVGVDVLAGPSEVVIFADESAAEDFVAADMNAQAEHTDGLSLLLTTSRDLGLSLNTRVKSGYWMHVKSREEAVDIINHVAPEHLQLMCRDRRRLAGRVVAGAVFLGDYSPAALGDYCIGPSHVLPTGRSARFSSGLSVYSFTRSFAVVEASEDCYRGHAGRLVSLAEIEGLRAHMEALNLRKKSSKKRENR